MRGSFIMDWIEMELDRISHMLIADYPKGDYMDGYVDALEILAQNLPLLELMK